MAEEQNPSPPPSSINNQLISQRHRSRPTPHSNWRPQPPLPPPHLLRGYQRPPPQYNSYQWNHRHQMPQRPPIFHQQQALQRPLFIHPTYSPPLRPPTSPQPLDHPRPSERVIDIDELRKKICKQVEYYFGTENFPTDAYLHRNMVDGWADVQLIAEFRNMQTLTNDTNLILDSLQTSQVVEVQGNKMRPRWI